MPRNSIFSAAWSSLELDHVRAFLETAGDEGLTWEAKAGKVTTRMVGESVCGLANALGGYLILGAEGGGGAPWACPGIAVSDPEPIAWVSRTIHDRLRPRPHFDAKSWPVEEGRHLIVVEVDPIAVPPCLTVDGLAYERVTSQTVKITDPSVLTRLLQRGEAATLASEAKARGAAGLIGSNEPLGDFDPGTRTRLSVGLAATGYAPDIGSRLFAGSFMDALASEAHAMATALDDFSSLIGLNQARSHSHSRAQAAIWLVPSTMPTDQGIGIIASWDGSVSVTWETTIRDVSVGYATNEVCRLSWETARSLVRRLGGYGQGHVVVGTLAASGANAYGNLVTLFGGIERKVDLDDPESLDLPGIERELKRASGNMTFEPEPVPPSEDASDPTTPEG